MTDDEEQTAKEAERRRALERAVQKLIDKEKTALEAEERKKNEYVKQNPGVWSKQLEFLNQTIAKLKKQIEGKEAAKSNVFNVDQLIKDEEAQLEQDRKERDRLNEKLGGLTAEERRELEQLVKKIEDEQHKIDGKKEARAALDELVFGTPQSLKMQLKILDRAENELFEATFRISAVEPPAEIAGPDFLTDFERQPPTDQPAKPTADKRKGPSTGKR